MNGLAASCNEPVRVLFGKAEHGVAAPEACDDGNTTAGDGCATDCTLEPACGDGTLDGGGALWVLGALGLLWGVRGQQPKRSSGVR